MELARAKPRPINTFQHVLDILFDQIQTEFAQIEALIEPLENLSGKNFKQMASRKNYDLIRRTLTAMILTSERTQKTLDSMEISCDSALDQVNDNKRINAINKVLAIIRDDKKSGLAYAEKLPFTIGDGWKPMGSISLARKLVNIFGYLAVCPFVDVKKFKEIHEKSLVDIQFLLDEYKSERVYYAGEGEEFHLKGYKKKNKREKISRRIGS